MGVKAFVKKAVSEPADCRIKISEVAKLCDTFIDGLVEMRIMHIKIRYAGTGLGAPGIDFPKFKTEAARALEKKLIGVCPECHLVTNGEQLIQVHSVAERMQREAGSVASDQSIAIAIISRIVTELSEDVKRLQMGKCPSCNFEEVLIFWRPHESKKLTKRLVKMGIEI